MTGLVGEEGTERQEDLQDSVSDRKRFACLSCIQIATIEIMVAVNAKPPAAHTAIEGSSAPEHPVERKPIESG
ncbi:hypothetical protein BX616_010074, partial [Lobosporangium transversale]